MAESENSTPLQSSQLSRTTNFRDWQDALLLREFQTVKATRTAKARAYLSKVAAADGCGPFSELSALALAGRMPEPGTYLDRVARAIELPLTNIPALAKRLEQELAI